MIPYDPEQLLVSVHIPKCAGTSFARWLEVALAGRVHPHYPDLAPPTICEHGAGWCVHGHFFHHAWDIGPRHCYPEARQYITVLRDPLQMVISSYFFQRRLGEPPATDVRTYLEQVLTWPRLFQYDGLPVAPGSADIEAVVDREFVWIGIVERLDLSLPLLARRLGVACPDMPIENVAPRTEGLPDLDAWGSRFRDRFQAEYALYDRALATLLHDTGASS